ncbi:MAG TPA: hypothetical protein VH165_32505 [Kofleriaceae bacterium]|jgi:hypothetical protein|nr:hypothetical protein [Kofleriaceae bacterium]
MKQANAVVLATVLATGALARAQPAPPDPSGSAAGSPSIPAAPAASPPGPATAPAPAPATGDPATAGVPGAPADPDGLISGQPDTPLDPYAAAAAPARRGPPKPPRPPLDFPEVLTTPTGWLLPAGVLYSKDAIDTGGGVTSDNRVGLGDVAEFGVATTDQVRERQTMADKPERIQPYITASFRLGIAENRLFDQQPGVTLGFRKSFERNHDDEKTRIAELTLVASKHLGKRAALHVGGALWDASLQSTVTEPGQAPPPEITLHGHDYKNQIRPFGGFEARPLPRSEILIDLGWAPEFCYQCADTDKIKLRPELSWGVRYEVARFMHLESGVRVPDIGNFNLLDAQIFGQVTFTSFALKGAVDSLK